MATAVTTSGNQIGVHYLEQLYEYVTKEPEIFLQPTISIQQTALNAAKAILDPLAREVLEAQVTRRNENKKKRKRNISEVQSPVLQLRQIYTEGLSVKQVWEQARRVLDAAQLEIERELLQQTPEDYGEDLVSKHGQRESVSGFDDEIEQDYVSDEEFEQDVDLEDYSAEEDLEVAEVGENDDYVDAEDAEDIEADSDAVSSQAESSEHQQEQQKIYTEDPNGLNDGFFSIDDFNKQSQFLEQMDVRGDDDEPSDEDEIDWTVDPLTQAFSRPKPGSNIGREEQEEEEEEEDGPAFGNVDLDGPDTDEDLEDMEEGDLDISMPGLANTNEIRYRDFFEPPPKKPSKTKRMRPLPKTQPPKRSQEQTKEDREVDLERAMADVRRDLLESEDEMDDAESDFSQSSDRPAHKKSKDANLSTHERQRAQIAAEIRQLEAANVAKKDWTLSGEATAHARPLNSLIEEDLEFERTGKPVPVITAEVSNDIEALIKRRILARDFDELVRRLPTALGNAAETRRGRAEVDDSKPATGLGEIYEQEHMKASDPATYAATDKRSKALKKQHEEIKLLWNEIRTQLDVLGSLHFKPKRLEVEIKTVQDTPRIAMEDARPAVTTDGGEDSTLAPQEIYKPGQDGVKGPKTSHNVVVNTKTGASTSKDELSREEKLRHRRREKERQKKASGNRNLVRLGKSPHATTKKTSGSKSAEQKQIVDDLKRGDVKVIGKGGAVESIKDKMKDGKNTGRRRHGESGKLGDANGGEGRSFTGGALKL